MSTQAFFQEGPQLGNTWDGDPFLQLCLRRLLPADTFRDIEAGLQRLGERAAFEMPSLAVDAECNPPQHVPYDPWGRRVDEIHVADGWRKLHAIAAEEGIVATAYERRHGEHSRLHQFARLYLYHPSSAICSCPLAMTDGAARVIEVHGDKALKENALQHLTSRDPAAFWTSGQWMTERAGGSDVSGTSTIARADGESFRLHGTKWFTSATTSEMAFTLARIEQDAATSPGLSLFYLELRNNDGQLDNILVHRLKDKLGTRALPTAELTMEGTWAQLVGEPGKGVRTIATLLNITRLYNACCAASQMRRAVTLATDYANRRVAFGKLLVKHPLHAETLEQLESETRGATLMVLHAAALLGKEETGVASENEKKLLRLLTPLTKLYTAKQGVAVCSEALECFGGAGYVEDTGLPTLLRDAQVLAIWEGTTNVLALDLLRAAHKDDSIALWVSDCLQRLEALDPASHIAMIRSRITDFQALLRLADAERNARRLAFVMARIHGALLLAEQHAWQPQDAANEKALEHWLSGAIVSA